MGETEPEKIAQVPSISPRAVDFDRRFLLRSRQWLRDEEIAYLTMSPPFTDEQQEAWFANLDGRKDYIAWGIEVDGLPVGVFGLKNIANNRGEYWGYIGEKQYWGHGIGRWMVETALERARELDLHLVVLQVLAANARARRLYERMGFAVSEATERSLWMQRQP